MSVRILWLLSLLLPLQALAGVTLSDTSLRYELVPGSSILRDPAMQMDPAAALDAMPLGSESALGRWTGSGGAVWMSMYIENRTEETAWALATSNHLFEDFAIYRVMPGGQQLRLPLSAVGDGYYGLDFQRHARLTLAPGEELQLLVRMQAGVVNAPQLSIATEARSRRDSQAYTALVFASLGAVVALLLYNFLIAIRLKSRVYGDYCIYAVTHLLFMLLASGVLTWLGGAHLISSQTAAALTLVAMLLFTRRFLAISPARGYPRLLLLIFALLLLGLALLGMIWPEVTTSLGPVVLPIYLLGNIAIIYAASFAAWYHYRPAYTLLAAWGILVASNLYGAVALVYVGPRAYASNLLPMIGGTLEMVLLSLALARQLSEYRESSRRWQLSQERTSRDLARKTEFLSTLTHEIRTPLHSILGGLRLLYAEHQGERRNAHLTQALYAGEALCDLVENLLERERIDYRGDLGADRRFDPVRLVNAAIGVFDGRAKQKGLKIELSTEGLPILLTGRPDVIRRALINLVGNAIKYTDHGHVRVSASVRSEAGVIRFEASVSDTGVGISAERQSKLFQPYERDPESEYSREPSIGLGLSITRSMLESAGGAVELRSSPGQGTQATFWLPVGRAGKTRDASRTSSRKPQSVLLIDDAESNLTVSDDLLSTLGHRVTPCRTLEAAFVALERDTGFSVVFGDFRLGNQNALPLLDHLRSHPDSHRRFMPIVIGTADLSEGTRLALHERGAVSLEKPFTRDQAQQAIERALTISELLHALSDRASSLSAGKLRAASLLFLEQSRSDMETLRDTAQELRRRQTAAHRIASAATVLGLPSMAKAALRVERRLSTGGAEPRLDALVDEFECAQLAIQVANHQRYFDT